MPPSPAKITLAIITAPRQAFEEILERRLVVQGLLVAAIFSVASFLLSIFGYYVLHKGSPVWTPAANPVASIGFIFLVAYLVNYVARMFGGKGDYPATVAVLAWSAPLTFLLSLHTTFLSGGASANHSAISSAVAIVLIVWSFALPVYALRFVQSITFIKSVASYAVAMAVAGAALAVVSSKAVMPFQTIKFPIVSYALQINQQLVMAWISTAALIFGLAYLAKQLDCPSAVVKKIFCTSLLALVPMAALTAAVLIVNPAGHVQQAHRFYKKGAYSQSIGEYNWILRRFPQDNYSTVYLGNALYSSGKDTEALRQYRKALNIDPRDGHLGIGAVYLAQGNLKLAEKEFSSAGKIIYPEQYAWLALLDARKGEWSKAIEQAEKATSVVDSPAAQVVLADAYAQKGNYKKSKEAVDSAIGLNPEFGKRFGKNPKDWLGAAAKLTRSDLKFPLAEL